MSSFKGERGTGGTGGMESLMTTELNSIANNANAIANTAWDNSLTAALWLDGDFRFNLATGITPAGSLSIELFLLPAIDGTNYPDGSATIVPSISHFRRQFFFRAVTGAQVSDIEAVRLPFHKFKALIINRLGVTLPSSGNILSFTPTRRQN